MVEIQLANKKQEVDTQQQVVDNNPKKEVKELYDTIIVGAGSAGYTAAIYSARYNLKTLILGEELGGQMNIDCEVENYPGFKKIKGSELMQKFENHAKDLGVQIEMDKVENIEKINNEKFKITTMFSIYYSKNIILALGTKRRKLSIPGEKEFLGRGVSYCATCDGNFYKDKTVAVIGGGDAAFSSAFIMLKHAKKVYIIHRRDEFRAKPGIVNDMKLNTKVEFVMNANVKEILGENNVTKIITDSKDMSEIKLDGVFIDVGVIPNTELAKKVGVELDEENYIKVTPKQETNVSGIYAVGDVTNGSSGVKQMIVAAAEGAIAATSAFSQTRVCKNELKDGDCND